MKITKELHELRVSRLLCSAVLTIGLVLALSLFGGDFSIVSHAESAGRVSYSKGANVRSSPSTSSSTLTSFAQNTVVSIRSQVQGSDGNIWYEVWIDADSLGYIRSDLVEITDGTTPPTSTATTTPQEPSNTNQSQAEVMAVNPVSAVVAGGSTGGVRVRSNASTSSQIVANVQNNLALTVTGQANSLDGDGKIWYQVNYLADGVEVSGFIRSDYVQLSGELTPYTEPSTDPEPERQPNPDEGTEPEQPPQVTKEYDTVFQDGVWYLSTPEGGYDIKDLFDKVNEYAKMYEESEKSVKTQKVVIVILVFLLVAAAGAVGFLLFKIKDMMDTAYFSQVESETLRRRSQGGRVMPTVGADKKGAPQGQRPAGAPQGQRPAGAPQGQRPSGAAQGQKPAGAGQGQKSAGAPQGQRPTGAPQSQKATGAPQGQKPSGAPQGQKPAAPQGQGMSRPQPKNFMAEEDEFEFEFLNAENEDVK